MNRDTQKCHGMAVIDDFVNGPRVVAYAADNWKKHILQAKKGMTPDGHKILLATWIKPEIAFIKLLEAYKELVKEPEKLYDRVVELGLTD